MAEAKNNFADPRAAARQKKTRELLIAIAFGIFCSGLIALLMMLMNLQRH